MTEQGESPERALVVERAVTGGARIACALRKAGFSLLFASDDREALECCGAAHVDLVVAEHCPGAEGPEAEGPGAEGPGGEGRTGEGPARLGSAGDRETGIDAVELVRRLRLVSDVPVVVMASCGSVVDCERAMRMGADRFLQFDEALGRLGQVARDLLASERLRKPVARAITTEEARAMRHQELRGLLQRLVVDCRGNIAEIARRMDRDRSTVRYHLRRMGMLDRSH